MNFSRGTKIALLLLTLSIFSIPGLVEAAGGEHAKVNHAAVMAGALQEGGHDDNESGGMIGFKYERLIKPRWSLTVSVERAAFSDDTRRQTMFLVGGAYHAYKGLSLVAGVGLEGRKFGEGDHYMARLGASYHIGLGKNFAIAPEAFVDFIDDGTEIYGVGIALAYGF